MHGRRAYIANETAMADVHPNETALIAESTATYEAWMDTKEKEQAELALTDVPALLASEIAEKGAAHRDLVRVQIIRHARTHCVGKYQSCMFLNVGLIVHAPAGLWGGLAGDCAGLSCTR